MRKMNSAILEYHSRRHKTLRKMNTLPGKETLPFSFCLASDEQKGDIIFPVLAAGCSKLTMSLVNVSLNFKR